MGCEVFVSFRTSESITEARALKTALHRKGVSAFVSAVDIQPGQEWRDTLAKNLVSSKLMVVLGTSTYGAKGTTSQGTFEELIYAKEHNIPLIVVKMCDTWKETKTEMELSGIHCLTWTVGVPLEDSLIDTIMTRLQEIRVIRATALKGSPSVAPAPVTWEHLSDISECGRQELKKAGINISTALQLQSLGYTNAGDLQYLGDEMNRLCMRLPPIQASKLKKMQVVQGGGGGTKTITMSDGMKTTQAPTPLPSNAKNDQLPLVSSGIVAGCANGSVQIWDLLQGRCTCTLEGHTDEVWSVALTLDGKTIVSGSDDRTVCVWDLSNGTLKRTLKGHTYPVNSVALTPDGKTIVSGSGDKTLCVWDLSSGTLKHTLGHTSSVYSVALTPDGKTIVSGSDDATVCVWDLSSGTLKRTLKMGKSVSAIAVI